MYSDLGMLLFAIPLAIVILVIVKGIPSDESGPQGEHWRHSPKAGYGKFFRRR